MGASMGKRNSRMVGHYEHFEVGDRVRLKRFAFNLYPDPEAVAEVVEVVHSLKLKASEDTVAIQYPNGDKVYTWAMNLLLVAMVDEGDGDEPETVS